MIKHKDTIIHTDNLIFIQKHISTSKDEIIGYATSTGKRYDNQVSNNKYKLILSYAQGYTFSVSFDTIYELEDTLNEIMEAVKINE